MKLFIDSADLKQIEEASRTGLIDGVTTNPSLVAKSGARFEDLLLRICELIDGPISAEVTTNNPEEMLSQGRELSKLHKNIYVKLPLTPDGLRVAKKFKEDGIHTNVTLCFSAIQGLLAAKAGATLVSPFVGRLDDVGQDGMQLIEELRIIYDNYGFETQILVASVRHVEHLLRAAKIGGDIATIPFKVFEQLAKHPLTDKGLAKFLEDWEKAKK